MSPVNLISLIDLTSLNETDTETSIQKLCTRATSSHGSVAAVCIYPQFIEIARKNLNDKNIKIATVANFPHGNSDIESVTKEIQQAIQLGADEIDVAMPHNDQENFISHCKKICGNNHLLKVILETGALKTPDLIYQASRLAINSGADFIKTSTGKIAVGATLEAATMMLFAIKDSGKSVGFKASGGIRTLEQANGYLYLAETIMGKDWITPNTFRFGASSLLDDLIKQHV